MNGHSFPDYAACSACGLCVAVCPAWQTSRDIRLTPCAWNKALQHEVPAAELGKQAMSCLLCGACTAICPEGIDLIALVRQLRALYIAGEHPQWHAECRERMAQTSGRPLKDSLHSDSLLLLDKQFLVHQEMLTRVKSLLGNPRLAVDYGADISLAINHGLRIPQERLQRFLRPLRQATRLIVSDSTLFCALREWLPQTKIRSLGESLTRIKKIRDALLPGDFYVIQALAYNSDFERMNCHYRRLCGETSCLSNLDLQRLAISCTTPPEQKQGDTEQVRWMLKGREPKRIIVEQLEDIEVFRQVTGDMVPVMHVAAVAG